MTLSLNQLVITYKDSGKTLHYHRTLDIPQEGFALLTGASGCGKTTLLHTLAGLITPTSGTISGDIHTPTALMFQESRLFPWRKVSQQLTDVSRKKSNPLPYLQQVGLEKEAHLYPASLSGGMARRLSLARTLYYGAETEAVLYLLDEPFTGVDNERILTLLPLLSQLNAPVLLSSHLPLLQSYASKVLTLGDL